MCLAAISISYKTCMQCCIPVNVYLLGYDLQDHMFNCIQESPRLSKTPTPETHEKQSVKGKLLMVAVT